MSFLVNTTYKKNYMNNLNKIEDLSKELFIKYNLKMKRQNKFKVGDLVRIHYTNKPADKTILGITKLFCIDAGVKYWNVTKRKCAIPENLLSPIERDYSKLIYSFGEFSIMANDDLTDFYGKRKEIKCVSKSFVYVVRKLNLQFIRVYKVINFANNTTNYFASKKIKNYVRFMINDCDMKNLITTDNFCKNGIAIQTYLILTPSLNFDKKEINLKKINSLNLNKFKCHYFMFS